MTHTFTVPPVVAAAHPHSPVWTSARPSLSRRLLIVAGAFLFWTLLGLFFASQIVVLANPPVTWGKAMQLAMPQWYSWGLLTPAILAFDRRFGAGRSLTSRLVSQLPLAFGWTAINLTLRLFARPLIGTVWPPSILVFVLERVYWDVLIYAVIAGFGIARDYGTQLREQERQASQVALHTTELERDLTEARLHSLRSQLQPHFLFNALNTISALTETDPKIARRLMEQLGQLLRVSLRHASAPLVTLAEELTFLDDYLAIESVRFEGRITVAVRADDDALEAVVPGFLLQPLVENAIRHGVGPRLAGGHIDVTAARDNGRLCLRVSDNGVGLAADWLRRRESGVGLRNAAARLEQLYPGQHLFEVTPGVSGGVDIRVELPWQSPQSQARSSSQPAEAPQSWQSSQASPSSHASPPPQSLPTLQAPQLPLRQSSPPAGSPSPSTSQSS